MCFSIGMNETLYVGEASASFVRAMERKLRALPPFAGIIFIHVKARPEKDGRALAYSVVVGVSQVVGKEAAVAAVKQSLADDLKFVNIVVYAIVGISGAAYDPGYEEVDSHKT